MGERTFADMDEVNAARKAKRAAVTERLERILLREFSSEELLFVWAVDGPDLGLVRQAIQNARQNARR
jgi:hypothetical protein